jgi:hypothetical protein
MRVPATEAPLTLNPALIALAVALPDAKNSGMKAARRWGKFAAPDMPIYRAIS